MHSKIWPLCWVYPERGIAFFDEVFVEADPITNPRWDRVLPVLEEEQIFMCRQMQPLLKNMGGGLVLDVGTGSGVFAIWAAKHGYRVLAIDINARALRNAEQNARANRITTCDNLEALQNGSICFALEKFDEGWIKKKGELFDIVFLSPPYNPTCPGVLPAQHASAGEDGQECFQKQIELVPGVLKKGGFCVGNQMTPVHGQEIQALTEIKNAFGQNCCTRYTRILKEDISTEKFLQGQYKTCLSAMSRKSEDATPLSGNNSAPCDAIEEYIQSVSSKHPSLTFIYYETIKNKNEPDKTIPSDQTYDLHDRSWDDRIWLHAKIIEHSSPPNLFPSPWLYIQQMPTLTLKLPRISGQRKKGWESSILRIANEWVKLKNLLQEKFDILFVDSAPHYITLGSKEEIPQECKLWLSDRIWSDKTIKADVQDQLLKQWQLNTRSLQEALVGPYYHPLFVGHIESDEWRPIQYTVREKQHTEFLTNDEKLYLNNILTKIEEKLNNEERDKIFKGIRFDSKNGYSCTELKMLKVQRFKNILEEYYKRVEHAPLNCPKAQTDLRFCHLAMHKELDRRFDDGVKKYSNDYEKSWSCLMGIPLSLEFGLQLYEEKKDKLPVTFRGGIWIYASGINKAAHRNEQLFFDFARFVWFLYQNRYNMEAVKKEKSYVAQSMIASAIHETKALARGISERWLVSENQVPSPFPKNWKATPLPELLDISGRVLRLWAQSEQPEEVFRDRQKPKDLSGIVDCCWKLVKDTLKVQACKNKAFSDIGQLENAKMKISRIENLWTNHFHISVKGKPFDLKWNDDSIRNSIEPNINCMALSRFIVAALTNCIRYAHPDKKIQIIAEKKEKRLQISFINHQDEKEINGLDVWLNEARTGGGYCAIPIGGYLRGNDLIEIYANELDGFVIFPDNCDKEPYELKLDIPWRQL